MNTKRASIILGIVLVLALVPVDARGQGTVDLRVIKYDNILTGPVAPGSTISYALSYNNRGPSDAEGIQLHETVPLRTTFNAAASTPGWSCTGTGGAGATCVLEVGSWGGGFDGTASFAVDVANPLPCGSGTIVNTVSISSNEPDSDYTNNTSVTQTPVDESECTAVPMACPMTPRYYMYTLEDANQPAGWQLYCYIISSSGPPSVESQARVCTAPGFDHEFRATRMPYGGWVFADCLGNASYGWPHWDPIWYRPGYGR